MQSRIMELASQREFYIAINTKLHQTLTEHDLPRLPNGVQPITAGGGVVGGDGLHPQQPQLQAMAAISSGSALHHGGEGVSGGMYDEDSQMQEGGALESEGSGLLMDTDNGDERMSLSSSTMSKEAQDSLLHAHFSTMQRTTSGRRIKSSGGGGKHQGLQEGLVASDPMLSSVAAPASQQGGSVGGGRGYTGGHSRHTHDQLNSNNNMGSPFAHAHHVGHPSQQHHRNHHQQQRHHQDRHTELLSASTHQVLENSDRLAAPPSNEGGNSSLNEVTHVTAAVQRPIASFASLPNDPSPMLSSTVGHPHSSNNGSVYFNNPSS